LAKPYSKYCNQLNRIPRLIAIYNPFKTTGRQPAIIARWAATRATPEVNKTTVLTKGNIKASNVSSIRIPSGGQTPPMVTAGERLAWKKAQKNGKKSIASDARNNSIPYLSPVTTYEVW
jgi:NaMN:DMB phosphoribosyltransferase